MTWELGPATNIKRPHFGNSANSGFRRRSVFCRVLQARQNLSVTGLLRFLYLSLQISSHECDRRTNEGFDAYLKTRHVGGWGEEEVGRKRKFDQHSCWGLAVSPLYWSLGCRRCSPARSPTLEGTSPPPPFRPSWNRNVLLFLLPVILLCGTVCHLLTNLCIYCGLISYIMRYFLLWGDIII